MAKPVKRQRNAEPLKIVEETKPMDEETKIVEKSKKKGNAPGRELVSLKSRKGVVYLGHIPHGFYEQEMKGFFSQFGDIVNIRLSRSKKTGRSRGYAFIQFTSDEVAKIVQQAMDKYILSGRHLKCEHVPAEKVHERMFFGANIKVRAPITRAIAKSQHNKQRTVEKQQARIQRLSKQDKIKREKLKKMGIDYEFKGYSKAAEEVGTQKKRKTSPSSDQVDGTVPVLAKLESPAPKKRMKRSKVAEEATPVKSAKKAKTPAKSAKKTPAKSVKKTPAKSAKKTPAKKSVEQTPEVAKSARKTPAKSSKKPAAAPKSAVRKSSRKASKKA